MLTEQKPLLIVWGTTGHERCLTLETEAFLIGRMPHCHLVLTDTYVSREHARVVARDGGYFVEDLKSTNGTWLNDEKVESVAGPLGAGDIITVGRSIVSISFPNAPTGRLVSPLVVGMYRRKAEKRTMEMVEFSEPAPGVAMDKTKVYKQVFISHSNKDDFTVTRLAKAVLKDGGFVPWVDHQDIDAGQDWDVAIQRAMKRSQSMIVVLSPEAVGSLIIAAEWADFLEKRKLVIPIIVRACEIPFRLKLRQPLDFTQDFDQGLASLLQTLKQ
ncbi:MAG TPA: TIR domain-containing protein [Aggregatilineaceae bacterium]|nr:TIR domain-containing protein [Aggregatilineaceae bacterium]